VTTLEIAMVIWVRNGSSADSPGVSEAISLKIPAKTGTMNATTTSITTTAAEKMKAGYIIAERICRLRASIFSSWKATRSSASSRRPELSPERTMERKRGSKICGRRSIASAIDVPASTSWRRPAIASRSRSSSVWSSSV
jgi:hypothetical protein